MGTKITLNVFHFLVCVIGGVISLCPSNNSEGYAYCETFILRSFLTCPSKDNPVHMVLGIPPNQTLQNEEVDVTVNITDYNSSFAPYTHLICMSKEIAEFPLVQFYYLNCLESDERYVNNLTVTWKTAEYVTVFLFTFLNGSDWMHDRYGCARHPLYIQRDKRLTVNVSLSQYESLQKNLFQMGILNISVSTSSIQTISNSYSNDDGSDGAGSGDVIQPDHQYQYRFFYDNKTQSVDNITNMSTIKTSHTFEKEGVNYLLVEVIMNESMNGTTTVYYGDNVTSFEVYEPIDKTKMKFKNSPGANVSVEVTASGSVPINVSWSVLYIGNHTNSTQLCSLTNITLPTKQESGVFNCSFTKPGKYRFLAVFKNKISNKSDTFTFTIKKSSNTKTVVTTSTTVVIVSLLIVVVVIAIISISVYISYRKIKSRTTETANFTFIDLQKPSRFQRLQINLMNIKEKLAKKKERKVGLVQPKDGEISDTDSFYGSLTHFPAHESL